MTPAVAHSLAAFAEPAVRALLPLDSGGFVAMGERELMGLDATGVLWRVQPRGHLSRVIGLASGRLAGVEGHMLCIRAARTGALITTFALDSIPADLVAAPHGGAVLALGTASATQLLRLSADGRTLAPLACADRLPPGTAVAPPVLGTCGDDVVVGVAGALHGLTPDGAWRWHADRHGFSDVPRATDAVLTAPPLDVGVKAACVAGFEWATGHGFFHIDTETRQARALSPAGLVPHVTRPAAITQTLAGPRLVVTAVDQTLASMDLAGRVDWQRDAASPVIALLPDRPGTLFAIHSPRPSVWSLYRHVYREPVCFLACLDADTGIARWVWPAPGPVSAAATHGDRLLVAADQQIFAISTLSREEIVP